MALQAAAGEGEEVVVAADTRAAGPCSARMQRKPLGPAAAPAPL